MGSINETWMRLRRAVATADPRAFWAMIDLSGPSVSSRPGRRQRPMARAQARLLAYTTWRRGGGGMSLRAVWIAVCMACLLAVGALSASSAAAESLCTDTWVGPAEGSWRTASNWSSGKVPTSADVACIGLGKTARVEESTNPVGVVQGEGAVVLSAGTLEVTNAFEVSKLALVTVKSGATLTGAGTLQVSGSLSYEGGKMSGAGSTVVLSGASGSITAGVEVSERAFINEGTVTAGSEATVALYKNALIKNTGTFKANGEATGLGNNMFHVISEGGSVVNTGLLEKTAGTGGTFMSAPFENYGTVASSSGTLYVYNSWSTAPVLFEGGSRLEGKINLDEASEVVGNVEASAATIKQESGTLSISSGHTITIGSYTLTSGKKVLGAGNLDISGSLNVEAGKMEGAGSTVVLPSASGTITSMELSARTLVNEGTITSGGKAEIYFYENAQLKNMGTYRANAEESSLFTHVEGQTGTVINTGVLEKTEGTGVTALGKATFENLGTLDSKTGKLGFLSGSPVLASNSVLEGAIEINGATATGGSFKGSPATLTLSGGSLSINNGSTAKIENLVEKSGATLTGAGTLQVSGSLSYEGGKMSGTGSTVVLSGASGSITAGVEVSERVFVNEGTITAGSEAWVGLYRNAQVQNAGTFKTNGEAAGVGKNMFQVVSEGGSVVNTGLMEKTTGTGGSAISAPFENYGTVAGNSGTLYIYNSWSKAPVLFEGGSKLEGKINLDEASEVVGNVEASAATIKQESGTLSISSGHTITIGSYTLTSGKKVLGAGNLDISGSLNVEAGKMEGAGSTVVLPSASGTITSMELSARTLVNEGTITSGGKAEIYFYENAQLKNRGTYKANAQESTLFTHISGQTGTIINTGLLEKTEGTGTTVDSVPTENFGTIRELTGILKIEDPVSVEASETQYGASNPSALGPEHATCGKPVDCVTGNETETQTDIEVGGRGVGLDLTRYYNAQAAAAGEHGAFGYGWSSSFSDHLVVNGSAHTVTVVQANGSTVTFSEEGGKLVAPVWTQDTLAGNSTEGYTLTMRDQTVYRFSGAGRLESVADRNGNMTSLGYNANGQLVTITDPSSRVLTLAYNAEGLVESATDPMQHVVKYAYEAGQLASVTLPSQVNPRWRFKYDTSHRMIGLTDGRGNETTNTYNSANQVISQKDFAGHTLKWEYEPFKTKITNETINSVTVEEYTSADELNAITHGYGTAKATTESFTYNERGEPLTRTDGNGHTMSYEYDGEGNKVKQTDPEGHETKWTYNAKHAVTSETLPSGEKATIEYDEHGNPIKVSRPAPEEKTQATRYEYNTVGELTAMIDPLERKWVYGYDTAGDRTSETDPEGDKTTWAYNKDSVLTSEVSPRGNVTGGKPSEYTTTFTRDVLGRLSKVTQPEGQETKYVYNSDSNPIEVTDPNGHKTTINYTPDGLPSKVTQANGSIAETNYNGANLIVTQVDGNKHTTKYIRNVLGQVVEIIDPLEHKTKETYDAAGNLATLVDASSRTTTYHYNKENEPTKVSYSESGTPTVEYGYTPNGQVSSMVDGTGTTSYTYDQLDRLIETKNGHGDVVGYGYDLANEITSVKYPNGKTVKDGYDKAGRLSSVSDWLSHTTGFSYNPDSQPITTSFPEASGESDHYAYNRTDQLIEANMFKGSETLASIAYVRDLNGQATKETQTGLPGEAGIEYGYDTNERLTKAGTIVYEYDPANNPTKIGAAINTFNAADQLTEGGGVTYAYNSVGQRTKATPTTGPASTYGYNQADVLTTVNRPEEGSTPKIEDSYTYDGNGLRASETINGTTKHLTWQLAGGLSLLLSDGSNSYIYGPERLPVEQINTKEEATYLHHGQAGSTRLLTNEKGETTGKCSYSGYGASTCEGATTTPLGYDGQYTTPDTGLIYLRARVYDPTTAQFLSVDPLLASTRAPYYYAGDNPIKNADPTGLCLDPTGVTCPIEHRLAIEAEEIIAGAIKAVTAGAVNLDEKCTTAYSFGESAALVPLPEDWGAQLFAKFAERNPTLARLFLRLQAKQSPTQPSNMTMIKIVLERLRHILGG